MTKTILTLSNGETITTSAPEEQIIGHITNSQGMLTKAFVVIGDVHIATAHIVKIESIGQSEDRYRPEPIEQEVEEAAPEQVEQANESSDQHQFELLEKEIREAMQTRDIFLLDTLIHDDLVFVNHEGMYLTKEMDLEAHRTLAVRFTEVSCKDLQIKPTKDGAVTISRIHLMGQAGDEKIDGDFIYTRVWQLMGDQYQIIAGHCTKL
ncbi:nuclear transport factor 2 family protein [Terribacillus saccharophilus]|uniref:nuclear transport factor 2 family protein n=1 Tax=Terribacillus saccharophilus TaxID=361277 RepID=UPI003982CB26